MPDMDRHAESSWVPSARALFVVAAMLATTSTLAQQANGTLHANGRAAKLEHAIAVEVDSATEPGYLDVVVVLSDRRLSAAQARDTAGLACSRTTHQLSSGSRESPARRSTAVAAFRRRTA